MKAQEDKDTKKVDGLVKDVTAFKTTIDDNTKKTKTVADNVKAQDAKIKTVED